VLIALTITLTFGISNATEKAAPNEDVSSICEGQAKHAEKLAKELFVEHRSKSRLRDYDATTIVNKSEIVVRFTRRHTIVLGDHPSVVFDCKTKRARYVEGE
jgi:UDP-glucose 6-dehydrogenase